MVCTLRMPPWVMDAGGGALDGARMHVSSVQVEHGSDDLDLEWLSSTTLGP